MRLLSAAIRAEGRRPSISSVVVLAGERRAQRIVSILTYSDVLLQGRILGRLLSPPFPPLRSKGLTGELNGIE